MSGTPSWPSLYDPLIELFPIEHRDPEQPTGKYLHDPHDIFRFTLYWTLVLYIPSFLICGTYAFFNLSLPSRRPPHNGHKRRPSLLHAGADGENIPLRRTDIRRSQSQLRLPSRSPAKQNETRSRLTFAIIVLFMFALFALGGAVVGSAVIGYVAAGLFKAAKFNMSTWIPFLSALLQTLVGFLALWPTIVDII